MKRLSFFLALLLLAVPCVGCMGAVAADEYKYVATIGIDKGETKRFLVTFLVQSQANASTSQSAAGESILLGAEGEDILEAISAVHMGVPYRLSFERVNTIAFSQEMAKEGVLERMTKVELNALNIRQSVKLLVSLCSARAFLQGMAGAGMQNITKLQYSLFSNYTTEGISPVINYSLVHEAVRGGRMDPVLTLGALDVTAVDEAKKGASEMTSQEAQKSGEGGGSGGDQEGQEKEKKEEKGESPDPQESQSGKKQEGATYTTEGIPRIGGMAVYAGGAALFDGWRMAGVLDSYDTRFLLMGSGMFLRGWVRVPYEEGVVVVYLTDRGDYKGEIDLSGDHPQAKLEISLTCEVLEDVNRLSKEGWESGLRQSAEEYIKAEINRVFELCKGLNSDAMGIGRIASRKFSSVGEWESYNWKSRYPALTAEFDVRLVPVNENVTSGLD